MQFKKKLLLTAMLGAAIVTAPVWADDDDERDDDRDYSYYRTRGEVTIVHTGDFHGHLTPRPNVRSDGDNRMEGGLARVYKKISMIREEKGRVLLMHTGDTLQGSGEALYTRGQAMVDVMDMFGYNAYTPGNWDFVYGPDRFKELFANPDGTSKRWGALVANLYAQGVKKPGHEGAPDAPPNTTAIGSAQDENVSQAEADAHAQWYFEHGVRLLPPYSIKQINGVKVGVIGCTTTRGPQVVGSWVTTGLAYTDCELEVPHYAKHLRTVEKVDLVVMISEIEIGRNIQLIRGLGVDEHVDLVLNSDMHEETLEPIKVVDADNKTTLISEQGMDGTMISEITYKIKDGAIASWDFKAHRIDDSISEDWAVAYKVAKVRYPFNGGFKPNTHVNPFSGTYLNGPLSQVVGRTDIALHRSNFAHEDMPAVIEGTSHDFIADAIRWWAKSDLATVRGFRYGTTVKPGVITRNDLFHYVPIGARVAKAGKVAANQLRNQIDNSSRAVLSSNPKDDRRVLPRYNNAYGDPTNALWGTSPGAGLPAMGAAAAPEGWGGGWLFAYSGDGFHMDFAPYFNAQGWVYSTSAEGSADYNTVVLSPPNNFSRARSLTLKMLCKQLPPAERWDSVNHVAKCDPNDTTTRYTTVITEQDTGRYKPAWRSNYTNEQATNLYSGYSNNNFAATACTTPAAGAQPNCGYRAYLLNANGWQYLQGIPNQPTSNNAVNQHFKAGLFTVAGYWYAQSPNTLNNCNNCYPTGTEDGNVTPTVLDPVTNSYVFNPNAAFLLPVNMKADGTASLDANGTPIVETDGNGNLVWEDGKPKVTGTPIDLTVIIEKYLDSLDGNMDGKGGTVDSSNLTFPRINTVSDTGAAITLPNTTGTLGFPTMQPLCGTLGQDSNNPNLCP